MFCFGTPCSEEAELRRDQERRSQSIDAEIQQDKDEYRATHRLLLLGPSNSGKSTFLNLLRILSKMNGLETQDYDKKQSIALEVKSTIREIIMTVIKAMPELNPPIALELPENEARAKYILEETSKPDYDFPEEFYDHCMKLWEDKGVMECYGRSDEYQLHDHAPYFMNPEKLQAIADPNFTPETYDLIRCRVKKMEGNRPFEYKFGLDEVKFHVIGISRPPGNFRKWIQCFSDVTAILFVVACDTYNLYTQEDPSKNRLEEALELFESIWNNRWLKNVSVIMLLNKQDLLKSKVLEGRFKIETYFPEYTNYQMTSDNACESGESEEVRRAKGFIRDLFVKVTKASPDNRHSFYTHFTCALDTESIRKVFNDCRDIIQRIHLRQHELL